MPRDKVKEAIMLMAFKKRASCAGGAEDISRWRNHRVLAPKSPTALKGRQTHGFGPSPFQGADSHCIRRRWFLHRLISAVPPGRKTEKLFLEIKRMLPGIIGLA